MELEQKPVSVKLKNIPEVGSVIEGSLVIGVVNPPGNPKSGYVLILEPVADARIDVVLHHDNFDTRRVGSILAVSPVGPSDQWNFSHELVGGSQPRWKDPVTLGQLKAAFGKVTTLNLLPRDFVARGLRNLEMQD